MSLHSRFGKKEEEEPLEDPGLADVPKPEGRRSKPTSPASPHATRVTSCGTSRGTCTAQSGPWGHTEMAEDMDKEEGLRKRLEAGGITVAEWGTGKAKTVAALAKEMAMGECELVEKDQKLCRVVHVVSVRVYAQELRGEKQRHVLLELYQRLQDGRTRQRYQFLSEKMKPGEDPLQAAKRGVMEELGIPESDVQVRLEALPPWEGIEKVYDKATHVLMKKQDSPSYPGLATEYHLHDVCAEIKGVRTHGMFSTQEEGGGGQIGWHFWGWEAEERAMLCLHPITEGGGTKPVSITEWEALLPGRHEMCMKCRRDTDVNVCEHPEEAKKDMADAESLAKQDRDLLERACVEYNIRVEGVRYRKLHGGFSGSIVTAVYGDDETSGKPRPPLVIKLDNMKDLKDEGEKSKLLSECMPLYSPKFMALVEGTGRAAMGIELVGAHYFMPDMMKGDVILCELRDLVRAATGADAKDGKRPWTPPGVTARMVLMEVFGKAMWEPRRRHFARCDTPVEELYKMENNIRRFVLREADKLKPGKSNTTEAVQKRLADKGVVELARRLLDAPRTPRTKSRKLQSVAALIHGDLNGRNVIIDSHTSVFIIDNAKCDVKGGVFADLAKMETCLLFEYLEVTADTWEEYVSMLRLLARVGFDNLGDAGIKAPALVETLAFVRVLRSCVYRYFSLPQGADWVPIRDEFEGDPSHDEWPADMRREYTVSLLAFTVRVFSFSEIATEQRDGAAELAMALMQQLLHVEATAIPVTPVPETDAQRDTRVLGVLQYRMVEDHRTLIDPISGQPLDLLEQCVPVCITSDDQRKKLRTDAKEINDLTHLGHSGTAHDAVDYILRGDHDSARAVLVLGTAASGKTVLQKMITVLGCMSQDKSPDTPPVVTIHVPLVDLVRELNAKGRGWDGDVIDTYLGAIYGTGSEMQDGHKVAQKKARVLYLLDGLDEIGDQDKKRVAQYVLRALEGRFVVTSRPVDLKTLKAWFGQRPRKPEPQPGQGDVRKPISTGRGRPGTKLTRGFVFNRQESGEDVRAVGGRFTPDKKEEEEEDAEGALEKLEAIWQWAVVVPLSAGMQDQIVKNRLPGPMAASFLQSMRENPVYDNLAKSPLLLVLLIHICTTTAELTALPADRRQVYERAIQMFLGRLKQARKSDAAASTQPEGAEKVYELLQRLAYARQIVAKQRDISSGDGLKVAQALDNEKPGGGYVQLWEHLEAMSRMGQAPLMPCVHQAVSPEGNVVGSYRFAHLTFQEYFAAKELHRLHENAATGDQAERFRYLAAGAKDDGSGGAAWKFPDQAGQPIRHLVSTLDMTQVAAFYAGMVCKEAYQELVGTCLDDYKTLGLAVSERGFDDLKGSCVLADATKLDISGLQFGRLVGPSFRDVIPELKKLETLQMGDTEMGDLDHECATLLLQHCSNLKEVTGQRVDERFWGLAEDVKARAMFAPHGAMVREPFKFIEKYRYHDLDLSQAGLTACDARLMVLLLKDNTSLTELKLDENKIGDDGATSLAAALKDNASLTKLDLGKNNIGDHGATSLADALKDNASLNELYLNVNEIGDEGARAVAEALKVNTSLRWLDLNSNSIGDDGATSLATALKDNASLTQLSLKTNRIGDAGAAELAAALKVLTKDNASLEEFKLYLGGNQICDEGVNQLEAVLKDHGLRVKRPYGPRCPVLIIDGISFANLVGFDGSSTLKSILATAGPRAQERQIMGMYENENQWSDLDEEGGIELDEDDSDSNGVELDEDDSDSNGAG